MGYKTKLVFLFMGILISVTSSAFAQTVNIEDDFEDGDFTNNPTWAGDNDLYTITTEESNNLLQLSDNDYSSPASLSTSSSAAYGSWEFYFRYNGSTAPSGSNKSEIFLISDITNLEGSVNGYAAQVGKSGDDFFEIIRYDDGSEGETVISDTTLIENNDTGYRVKVSRDLNGRWNIEVGKGLNGQLYDSGITTIDNTYQSSSYFGFLTTYTSSRTESFFYDDIKVTKITPPLDIQNVIATDNQTIDVSFNLDVDPVSIQLSDFTITPSIGNPDNISTSGNVIQLIYDNPIPGGEYTLTVSNIDDIEGNTIEPDTGIEFQLFDSYADGDLVINEFAYDYPTTINEEYIEIKNTSNKYLNIADWQIADNNRSSSLGSDPVPIEPNGFLVISADTTQLFNVFGNRPYHQAGFPALNNTTPDAVQLITKTGTKADSLTYNSDWGGTDVSLERRSDSASSIYKENWGNSPNPNGGTPGIANEVTEDNTPPKLTDLNILSTQTLQLVFDERLDRTGSYSISNSNISAVNQTAADTVNLSLESALQDAQTYTLSIADAVDIFANTIAPTDTSFTFYDPSPADSGDVVINEFMYAPPITSSEYIELYNHSHKSLDLQGWTLSDSRTDFEATISGDQLIVPPNSYVVIAPDNTIESEHPDITLIAMSDFPALNNGGDQIIIRNSQGILLDSLAYTSDWGGDEVALERRTIDVSSTYQSNWGGSPNDFGTPGTVNQIDPDTKAPEIASFEIRSNTEVAIIFSEQTEKNTVEDTNNYSISGTSTVVNTQLSKPDTVLLSINPQLQNAQNYTLSVKNIADLFGNIMGTADTSFIYYEISTATKDDIFVNEFNFVPPNGSTEYIELYNPTSKSFNLQEWTLSDSRNIQAVITDKRFIIPPNSYALIAPDNTIESLYPDIALIAMSDFPALNNGGDQIIIRNKHNTLLDSLEYTAAWGGEEVALERRTVNTSGIFSENWDESPNGFGTPGISNEIQPDQTPPSLESILVVNANTLTLTFSERVSSVSATDNANYQISPLIGIQLISVEKATVTVYLNRELVDGEFYQVTVSDITDIFGNTLNESTREFEYLHIDEAQSGDIVINEILYNPGSSGRADFIELYNTTDRNFDLTNWTVGDYSTETTIKQPLQIRANEYLVLTGNKNFASSVANAQTISGFPSLNNNTDDVYIRNQNGTTIDSVHYSQSWSNDTEGASLERKDPLAASNDISNWQTNDSVIGISAGQQNATFQEDNNAPQMIFATIINDNLFKVRFNEFIHLSEDISFYINNLALSVADFDSTKANVIFLSAASVKEATNTDGFITIKAKNLSDVKGNIAKNAEIPVAKPIQAGDLVINEIMFNPLADSDDNLPDQTEYVELRNTRDYPISLEGLFLHDNPDETGDIRSIYPFSTTAKWVVSQGHVLIHADETDDFKESRIAKFFELDSSNMQSILRANSSSLSLASSNDAIYIADSTGTVIDSVLYDQSWHNPNIIDTRGISLERISPNGSSNNQNNWGSSVTEKGGTPNAENSIYQEDPEITKETGITFTPNPFSPDGDGYEDNLFINYKLDQQDYLMKVRIYDRYGRLVRTLADGKRAGFEGHLIWDGRKDDGSRNRIGFYIVVFEAYDSGSSSNLSFKKTVVLARRLN